jgi:phosphate starvation-inducible PhoH-like protein
MKAPPKRRTKRASSYSEKNPDEMAAIPLVAKTERQQDYIDALKRCSQVIALGPAGSGKTYITTTYAASLYKQKLIDKIIITRPMVPTGRDIGFLPGNLHEKTLPWAMPVVDILYKHLSKAVVDTAMKGTDQRSPNIEIVPLALIRGRTFDDAFIIVDEAQNLTIEELKALVTRVGENTSLVVDGDINQSDLKGNSGLSTLVKLVERHHMDIPVIEFTIDDCVRSGICKQWLEVFHKEGM